MTPIRTAYYTRVSSEQQAAAHTIESQISALSERARSDGTPVPPKRQFVDDGISGATLARPALDRLRDLAAVGAIDRIYVHSPDRLARNYAYQVLLLDEWRRVNVELVFLNKSLGKSPEDDLLLQMQGIIAEYERAKFMERSRRGKRHAAQGGSLNVMSCAPFGYRYVSVREGGGKARYEPNAEQARGASQAATAPAPAAGMLLHIDGSRHRWFQDERWYELIVILDDASSQIYYAQLVEEESTATVMAALWEVIEQQGLFCALYSDRGSHFWLTPKVGGKVDPHRLTQVGRALRELGVQMIPAYSPQARGRSERNFGTWQGRLPQELRLRGIQTVDEANRFLREHYAAEFNRRFQVTPACRRKDLDLVFALQYERTVNRDNTVSFQNLNLQIERVRWRATLAGCNVTVHQHLDGPRA